MISDFIYVDLSKPDQDGGGGSSSEHDLEGHVMAIEERWFVLCRWIEERGRALHRCLEFAKEKEQLIEWLKNAEQTLRGMEQRPTEETSELLNQVKQIMVGHSLFIYT